MHPECVCLHESGFRALNHIFGELGLHSERLEFPGSWNEWRTPCRALWGLSEGLEEIQLLRLYREGGDACPASLTGLLGERRRMCVEVLQKRKCSAHVTRGFRGLGLRMARVASSS